jgi:hypothetical protein
MFKKKQFITIVLIGLVLVFASTLVVTHAVPYSQSQKKLETVRDFLDNYSNQK